MNKIQLLFLFAPVSFIISSCNYYVNKGPTGAPSTKTAGLVDFQRVNRQVFQPKCSTCHGASMTQFESVQKRLSQILDMVQTRQMPPGGGLPQDEIDLIRQWMADGAPEAVDETPTPSPEPTPAPVAPSFERVMSEVIQPKCLMCHSGVPRPPRLKTYSDVIKYIDVNAPAQSHLLDVVTRTPGVAGRMPPFGEGLKNEQIQLLRDWIEKGAPE